MGRWGLQQVVLYFTVRAVTEPLFLVPLYRSALEKDVEYWQ